MKPEEIQKILADQRAYFASGRTLSADDRIHALNLLRAGLLRFEDELLDALTADLGKSRAEGYMCELGMCLDEIRFMIRHLREYMQETTVPTPIAQTFSRSYVKPSPLGTVLIMSPWNYPLLLTIDPLIDAIAAGNTAVVKPSAYSPNTSAVLDRLIRLCFNPAYVTVVTGGRAENSCLLQEHFDHIFFTGSQAVGREVMRHAADHLTPVTLELGGKSPCIVDKSAKLKLAARRIVFGKYLNCGQTCVAPDYIYCDESLKDDLIRELKREIRRQFGAEPLENKDYGKIINEKHFHRLLKLADPEKLAHGGRYDPSSLQIEPTILDNITWDDPVMKEEIFGPILPILTYRNMEDALEAVRSHPHPLALYLFTENKKTVRHVTESCAFGGGCINDTIIHLATPHMAFGGTGASGMGCYHGRDGFNTFSHRKSIVDKKTFLDLPMRYQPYTELYDRMIRFFMK